MPVILRPDDYGQWLDAETTLANLQSLLKPYPAEAMETWRVSERVNAAKNEEPGLAKRVEVA